MNTNELRTILADEIRRLRSGKSKPPRSNAISNAASKIIATVRLDMAYCRMTGQKPMIPFVSNGKGLPAPKKARKA